MEAETQNEFQKQQSRIPRENDIRLLGSEFVDDALSELKLSVKESHNALKLLSAAWRKEMRPQRLNQSLPKKIIKDFSWGWALELTQNKFLRFPLLFLCGIWTAFASGILIFSLVFLLWLPLLPLALSYLASSVLRAIVGDLMIRKALKRDLANFKDVRIWVCTEHKRDAQYPLEGVMSPPIKSSEDKWQYTPWSYNLPGINVHVEAIAIIVFVDNKDMLMILPEIPNAQSGLIAYRRKEFFSPSDSELHEALQRAIKKTNFKPTELFEKTSEAALAYQNYSQYEAVLESSARIRNEQKIAWDDTYITEKMKMALMDRIEHFNYDRDSIPGALLISGKEGHGKSHFLTRIQNSLVFQHTRFKPEDFWNFGNGIHLSVEGLLNGFLQEHRYCIIIDDLDRLFSPPQGSDRDVEIFIRNFIQFFDRVKEFNQIWIIGTARDSGNIHREIRDRFVANLKIQPLDLAGVSFLTKSIFEKRNLSIELSKDCREEMATLSPRNLIKVIEMAFEAVRPEKPEEKDFKAAFKDYKKSTGTEVDPNARWDRLILSDETKISLKTTMRILRNAKNYKESGYILPKGLLLFGPAGTGKTQIARTLANESGLAFKAVTTSDLKGPYIGHGAKQTKEVFAAARSMAPCILFIDEIESCAKKRDGDSQDQIAQEVVTQMLAEMDGAASHEEIVFVVAATNLPEEIDSAVLSRFSERIEIPLPGHVEIKQLLQLFLADQALDFALEEHLEDLAGRFKGASGRELRSIIQKAQMRMLSSASEGDELVSKMTLDDLLKARDTKDITQEEIDVIWSKIVLPEAIQKSMLRSVQLFNSNDKAAPKGLLLYGPPGTGKSRIAQSISESCNCQFFSLNIADLKGQYIGTGATKTKALWAKARQAGRAIIFIDECDALFQNRSEGTNDSLVDEIINTFLAEWDGLSSSGQIWVIGATNRKDVIDPAILSRFGDSLEIPTPDAAGRIKILQLEVNSLGLNYSVPEAAGKLTTGLSGRMLNKLASTFYRNCGDETPTDQKLAEAITQIRAGFSESVDEDSRWDSLILAPSLVEQMHEVGKMLKNVEFFRENGVEIPSGLLLYGPPGTGKTQIARTLANESGVTFLSATTADIKAAWVGQSGKKVKALFEKARGLAPCILFLDEIESIVPSRNSGSGDQFTQDIVTQMLQELDGVKKSPQIVFLVGATNIPDAVDSAILSRFSSKVEIPLPEAPEREALLRVFCAKTQKNFDFESWAKEMAAATEGMSGRDLKSMCKKALTQAAMRALDKGDKSKVILDVSDFGKEVSNAS